MFPRKDIQNTYITVYMCTTCIWRRKRWFWLSWCFFRRFGVTGLNSKKNLKFSKVEKWAFTNFQEKPGKKRRYLLIVTILYIDVAKNDLLAFKFGTNVVVVTIYLSSPRTKQTTRNWSNDRRFRRKFKVFFRVLFYRFRRTIR